jgi:UbiD family decarboxylase
VTHRDNPIFTMSCLGIPLDDNLIWCMAKSAMFLQALRQRGLPVGAVNSAPECSSLFTIVSLTGRYPGIAADVAHLLWGIDGAHATPYIAVVDSDIDPFDISQVLHAVTTKCHPLRDLRRVGNVPVTPLLPFLDPSERRHQQGAMACFDCTWPPWSDSDIPQRISFVDSYPKEVQNRALETWMKYGFRGTAK